MVRIVVTQVVACLVRPASHACLRSWRAVVAAAAAGASGCGCMTASLWVMSYQWYDAPVVKICGQVARTATVVPGGVRVGLRGSVVMVHVVRGQYGRAQLKV